MRGSDGRVLVGDEPSSSHRKGRWLWLGLTHVVVGVTQFHGDDEPPDATLLQRTTPRLLCKNALMKGHLEMG